MNLRHALLIAVLAAAGCATPVRPSEHGDPASVGKVLIAMQGTPFKRALALRIAADLVGDGRYVKVVDTSAVGKEKAADYDAIAVLDRVYNGKLSSDGSAFLSFVPDRRKVVLVVTVTDEDWDYRGTDIDAVTAPSSKGGVDGLAVLILEKLRSRLPGE